MKKITITACLSGLIFAASTFAAERSPIARIAWDSVDSAYRSGGMTSVKTVIQDCYKRDLSGIYCIYMDTAGRLIDISAAKFHGFPPDEYFLDEQYLPRVGPSLINAGLSMTEANAFLRKCGEEITAEVDLIVEE